MIPADSIPANVTPCFSENPAEREELTRLFDSTDLMDHQYAQSLCRECPFYIGCGMTAVKIAKGPGSWAGVPSGTWGGVLWKNGRPITYSRTRLQQLRREAGLVSAS